MDENTITLWEWALELWDQAAEILYPIAIHPVFGWPFWIWAVVILLLLYVLFRLLGERTRRRLYGWYYGLSLAPVFEFRVVDSIVSVIAAIYEALMGVVEIAATILEGVFGGIGLLIQIGSVWVSERLEGWLRVLMLMLASIRERRDDLRAQRTRLRYNQKIKRMEQRQERKAMRDDIAARARGECADPKRSARQDQAEQTADATAGDSGG